MLSNKKLFNHFNKNYLIKKFIKNYVLNKKLFTPKTSKVYDDGLKNIYISTLYTFTMYVTHIYKFVNC